MDTPEETKVEETEPESGYIARLRAEVRAEEGVQETENPPLKWAQILAEAKKFEANELKDKSKKEKE